MKRSHLTTPSAWLLALIIAFGCRAFPEESEEPEYFTEEEYTTEEVEISELHASSKSVLHEAKIIAENEFLAFMINIPDTQSVEPARLILRNLDPATEVYTYIKHLEDQNEIQLDIGPNVQVIFDISKREKSRFEFRNLAEFEDIRHAPYLGNGKIVRRLDLAELSEGNSKIFIEQKWPYIMFDAHMKLSLLNDSDDVSISISADGLDWFDLPVLKKGSNVTAHATEWFDERPVTVYNFFLIIESAGDIPIENLVASGTLTTAFQFAARTIPSVGPGENNFEVFLDFAGQDVPEFWNGAEISFEWYEISDE